MTVKRHSCKIKRLRSTLTDRGQRPQQDPVNDTTVAADVLYSREPLNGRELELARQVNAQMSERASLYVDSSWAITTDDYLVDDETSDVLNIGSIVFMEGIQVEAILTIGRAA